MKKKAKSKRADAERAAVHYAHSIGCVLTHKAVRAQWQKVDFFGSDVMGIMKNGKKVFIQATAGQYSAVSTRRRKLEKVPWHHTDKVLICQLISNKDSNSQLIITKKPMDKRRTYWFFRIHEYKFQINYVSGKNRVWETKKEAVEVPKEWFKAYKKAPD